MNMQQLLEAEGLTVKPEPGWEDRTNARTGETVKQSKARFKPEGVLLHWDAIASHPASNDVYVHKNRYGGTLYHQVVEWDTGAIRLLSDDGYIWNAGSGDFGLVEHIRSGVGGVYVPQDFQDSDRVSGNPYFYGITIQYHPDYDGAVPDVMADAMYRAAAAICRRHGWDERHVHHHRSWTRRKPDINTLDVAASQAVVARILEEPMDKPPHYDAVPDYAKASWQKAWEAGLVTEYTVPGSDVPVERLFVFLARAGVI